MEILAVPETISLRSALPLRKYCQPHRLPVTHCGRAVHRTPKGALGPFEAGGHYIALLTCGKATAPPTAHDSYCKGPIRATGCRGVCRTRKASVDSGVTQEERRTA